MELASHFRLWLFHFSSGISNSYALLIYCLFTFRLAISISIAPLHDDEERKRYRRIQTHTRIKTYFSVVIVAADRGIKAEKLKKAESIKAKSFHKSTTANAFIFIYLKYTHTQTHLQIFHSLRRYREETRVGGRKNKCANGASFYLPYVATIALLFYYINRHFEHAFLSRSLPLSPNFLIATYLRV